MDVIPIRSMAIHLMSNNDALAYINHCHNILGSQSETRDDEVPSVKVCPKPSFEKQLTWFDCDKEEEMKQVREDKLAFRKCHKKALSILILFSVCRIYLS